jgi:hypothetical protein
MRDIVADNRNRAPTGGSHLPTVKILGAGTVTTGDDGAKYRPYQPPETEEDRSGWRDAQALQPPPGIDLIDQMVAAQDERDLIERAKQMAAARQARAMVEADLKQRDEDLNKKQKGGPQK